LDDRVDAPDASREQLASLITRQRSILERLYNHQYLNSSTLSQFEWMLVSLITYDLDNRRRLQEFVRQMFAALEFDAQRRYRLSPRKSLETYSENLGKAYTNGLMIFAGSAASEYTNNLVYQAGVAAHYIHILRDFWVDLSLGYFNISQEEIVEFGWSIDSLRTVDLSPWVRRVIDKARESFEVGLVEIGRLRTMRYRFLGYAKSIQYILVMRQITLNGFELRDLQPLSKTDKFYMLCWALIAALRPGFATKSVKKIFN
jgi:phytoene/squalene synthetase